MVAVKIGSNFSILSIRVFASSLVDGLKSTLFAISNHETKTYTYKELFTASPSSYFPKIFGIAPALAHERAFPMHVVSFLSLSAPILILNSNTESTHSFVVRSAIKWGCWIKQHECKFAH